MERKVYNLEIYSLLLVPILRQINEIRSTTSCFLENNFNTALQHTPKSSY
jgi:hypothetical protein